MCNDVDYWYEEYNRVEGELAEANARIKELESKKVECQRSCCRYAGITYGDF